MDEAHDNRPARSDSARRERRAPATPLTDWRWALLPYAVFLVLLGISWNRWIEPYVDSGRELMTPLRVARGERLYQDVRFYHGPLGPYLAAGLELVHARSLALRVALALAIALLHVEALRRLARKRLSADRTALALSLVIAAVFFAGPGGHLFPFSLDTALAVTSIAWALHLATATHSSFRDGLAGACLWAALLARPEMGFAAIIALAFDVGGSRRLFRLALAPILAAVPPYALLSAGVPWNVLRNEGWLALLGPPAAFRNVYASYAGVDRPGFRLAELGLAAAILTLVAVFLALTSLLAARAGARSPAATRGIEIAAFVLLGLAAWRAQNPPPSLAEALSASPPLIRVVPIVAIGVALWRIATRILRKGAKSDAFAPFPDAVLLTSAFFASRLLLAAGYSGPYGSFLLPLPLLVVAGTLFSAADRAAGTLGSSFPRLTTGALVIFLIGRVAALDHEYRHEGWTRVETPAGGIYLLEPVAETTRLTLEALSTQLPSGGTLVGFPEGGFFNYVLDRRNSLPQEQFFPGHLDAAGEQEVIRRIAAYPPDAVLICNVLAVGHGSLALGKDYLVELGRYLEDRFMPAASYGPGAGPEARIGDPQFFITIRVPRSEPPAPAR